MEMIWITKWNRHSLPIDRIIIRTTIDVPSNIPPPPKNFPKIFSALPSCSVLKIHNRFTARLLENVSSNDGIESKNTSTKSKPSTNVGSCSNPWDASPFLGSEHRIPVSHRPSLAEIVYDPLITGLPRASWSVFEKNRIFIYIYIDVSYLIDVIDGTCAPEEEGGGDRNDSPGLMSRSLWNGVSLFSLASQFSGPSSRVVALWKRASRRGDTRGL